MIGQIKVKQTIDRLSGNNFPRFTIITGSTGSGKKMIARYIGRALKAQVIYAGIKVGEVRDIIDLAYKQVIPTLYIIADADQMSIAAKNALLKITEEPPKNSYFVMTVEDMGNTLATLKSRGTEISMDIYSPDEILEYAKSKEVVVNNDTKSIIENICKVPGDVNILAEIDILKFSDYILKVIDNIARVSGANAFKIPNEFIYKEGDKGYPLNLFMRGVMYYYSLLMINPFNSSYGQAIKVTSKYLSDLNMKGVNKRFTMDMWILEMRGVLK